MESVKLCRTNLAIKPLRFHEVRFASKVDAAVDLLADETKRLAGFQPEGVEQVGQEALEFVPAVMRLEVADGTEAFAKVGSAH